MFHKHPVVVTIMSVLVVSLPQWIESVWSIFSSEPLAVVLRRSIVMPLFSAYWITVPCGLLMFAVLLIELRKSREVERRTQIIASVSQIPDSEKEMLDYGAGIEEAIHDYNIVCGLIATDIKSIGRIATRHTNGIKNAKDLTKKRRRTIRAAKDFDRQSLAMEPRVVRLENSTNLLGESFVGFVALNNEREVLIVMRENARKLLGSVPSAISGIERFHGTIVDLKKQQLQEHFSQSLDKIDKTLGRIIVSIKKNKRGMR